MKSDILATESIKKLLWRFSWPAIVGMLCNALYNIVDRVFVGRGVGSLAIAATTVAFPIMIIMLALALLIGVGATALISIRLGERKREEAEVVAANAAGLLALLPLLFTALYLPFADPILQLFGASPEVMPYARDFVHIIMLGSVFGGLSMGMNNFIRAEGNPMMAMSTQVLGALINGVLNYLFIFKLGLGIKGSALATVSGQLFSTVWVLGYYLSGRSLVKLRLKNFRPHPAILWSIVSIGFAPFAMQLASSLQQVILIKMVLAYSGDLALSAVGIMMSVMALLFMPILGISQGAQPLIGFNYGARQFGRVKDTFKIAAAAASCVSAAGYLVLRVWPAEIAGLFSKGDTALTGMTSDIMPVFLSMVFVIGFQIVGAHYFQAVGKAVQAAVLSLSRQVLLFIPLLLILPRFWGIDGVWRSAPIADGLSVLITAVFVVIEMIRLPESQPLPQPNELRLEPVKRTN
ncbi:MAG: MATE family efflux transporter [Firmicutes bacterium]|nr:MATE family efflux transporter [Bacillota bacterium]